MPLGRFARLALTVLAITAGAAGCRAGEPAPIPAPAEGASEDTLLVASNGWHTAIIVRRVAVSRSVIPEVADFTEARFLEFGWGDREYYPDPRPSVGAALAAGLLPTDSVIHMAGRGAAGGYGAGTEVLALGVSSAGLQRLIAAVGADFDRGENKHSAPISRGLTANSHFYPAHGTFYLFNTCNTWVAEKLTAAGIDVTAGGIITADDLMERLRPLARETSETPATP